MDTFRQVDENQSGAKISQESHSSVERGNHTY